MDLWDEIKKLQGYQSGNGRVDSYGVDHSGFSTRDELEYQSARLARENLLAENFSKQGIAEENYPQLGTNFWGGTPENNYGFGTSNIKQNIENMTNGLNNTGANNGQVTTNSDYTVNTESLVGKPSSYFQNNNTSNAFGINQSSNATPALQNQTSAQLPNNSQQQLRMPKGSEQQITMPKPQQPTTWDKFKDWAENTGDAMQAGAVGYTTGATLGNFDEGMGLATEAVTLNSNNYTIGRDATRQLQKELKQRHPYIYDGAEFIGTMTTPMHLAKETSFANKALNAFTDTLSASAGYAENWNDFITNLAVNGIANGIGVKAEQLPMFRAIGSNLGRWMAKNGSKFIKQGINSSADKLKNVYYKEDEDEKKYY
ncbi:MAG: hypothetical protein IKO06_02020 [Alphaproteobacteria bacterium]|nr:hypothetical protein [Alphaproteobacteria bacterium]